MRLTVRRKRGDLMKIIKFIDVLIIGGLNKFIINAQTFLKDFESLIDGVDEVYEENLAHSILQGWEKDVYLLEDVIVAMDSSGDYLSMMKDCVLQVKDKFEKMEEEK